MNRIEQVRMAIMIMNHANNKPETVEEVIAIIEKIIKQLQLNKK
tara:strand:+ start:230 stop:361 length:132 start_codon:yes stop_codon:yes gene_type:complete